MFSEYFKSSSVKGKWGQLDEVTLQLRVDLSDSKQEQRGLPQTGEAAHHGLPTSPEHPEEET